MQKLYIPVASTDVAVFMLWRHCAKELFARVAEILDVRGGSFFLVRTDRLQLIHCFDPGHAPQTVPYPLPPSITKQALKEKRPLLIPDVSQLELEGVARSGWTGYQDDSALVIPILDSQTQPLALVCLHNKASAPFSKMDLPLLRQISYELEASALYCF